MDVKDESQHDDIKTNYRWPKLNFYRKRRALLGWINTQMKISEGTHKYFL
jgi:hypothetical protein